MQSSVAACVVLAVLAACIQCTWALDTSAGSWEGWDIQPGAVSAVMKDDGHEAILAAALKKLPKDQLEIINAEKAIEGTRFNDMPGNGESVESLTGFLRTFMSAEAPWHPELLKLLTKFVNSDAKKLCARTNWGGSPDKPACRLEEAVCSKLIERAKELTGQGEDVDPLEVQRFRVLVLTAACGPPSGPKCVENAKVCKKIKKQMDRVREKKSHITAIARSHIGCKQGWHSMCPVATDRYGRAVAFNNQDGINLMYSQVRRWWKLSILRINRYMRCTKNKITSNTVLKQAPCKHFPRTKRSYVVPFSALDPTSVVVDTSDFYIGSIAHMIGDSFAPGHTVRDRNGEKGGVCGGILSLMGYTMQHGNGGHTDSDHSPFNLLFRKAKNAERRKELVNCAVSYASELMGLWAKCKSAIMRSHLGKQSKDLAQLCAVPESLLDRVFRLGDGTVKGRVAVKQAMCGGSTAFYSAFGPNGKHHAHVDREIQRGNLKKSVMTVNYGKGKKPFGDCDKDLGNGKCEIIVYENNWALVKGQYAEHMHPKFDAMSKLRGIPAVSYHDYQKLAVQLFKETGDRSEASNPCLGQETQTEAEHSAVVRRAKGAWAQARMDVKYKEFKNADATKKKAITVDAFLHAYQQGQKLAVPDQLAPSEAKTVEVEEKKQAERAAARFKGLVQKKSPSQQKASSRKASSKSKNKEFVKKVESSMQ